MYAEEAQEQSEATNSFLHSAIDDSREEIPAETVSVDCRTGRVLSLITIDGNASEDMVSGEGTPLYSSSSFQSIKWLFEIHKYP